MNINLTLIGQMVSFGIFVWFCMKYVWPPITSALRERQQRIAEGLAAAAQGEEAEAKARGEADAVIAAAKAQAAEIVSQAQKRGSDLVEEARDTARGEADRIREQAGAEMEQELSKARDALRKQVGSLAVDGASRILSREIQADAHDEVIKDLVAQI